MEWAATLQARAAVLERVDVLCARLHPALRVRQLAARAL
jgi:hypothetical protein